MKSQAKAESPFQGSMKSSDESEDQSSILSPVRPRNPAQPNVAVITVYDKELSEQTAHQHKRHKKSPAKKTKSSQLAVQVMILFHFKSDVDQIVLTNSYA